MKVVVIGATGMLGNDLERILQERGHQVFPLSSKDLDIRNEKAVRDCRLLSKKNADWVVNCAAYTAVDQAESEPENAWDINSEAVLNLCEKLSNGPRLIHISTDFVFDGTKGSPYTESDETNPLCVYGQTKLGGEHYIEAMLDDPIILRTSWLYGTQGKSFPKTMIKIFALGNKVRVVNDQWGCPTSTIDLANAIVNVLELNLESGTYHACGNDSMSWFEFAKLIHSITSATCELEPIPTSDYPTPAKRPRDSRMSNEKLKSSGVNPWRSTESNLTEFIKGFEKETSL